MSTFYLERVKRFKRGAVWGDGSPRMCTRCAADVAIGEPGTYLVLKVETDELRT